MRAGDWGEMVMMGRRGLAGRGGGGAGGGEPGEGGGTCGALVFCQNLSQCSSVCLLLKCCFMSTETVGLSGTGVQDGHLDCHTAPEL